MKRAVSLWLSLFFILFSQLSLADSTQWLEFKPPQDLTNGKNIVIVTGDEEYRSEEWGPMLGKILSQKHGFNVKVLFAINPETGFIDPNHIHNIPGLASLDNADLMILGTRWRKLPPAQLEPILQYLNTAKPLIAIRTATHAFNNDDFYGGYDWQNFGVKVVGENWLNHHGEHKVQGGRPVVEAEHSSHPILNSATDFFTYSDIYGIANLDQDKASVLLRGAVTETLDENSANVKGELNNPMMPLAWLKSYPTPDEKKQGLCFATTAGAAIDFKHEQLRRLIVNASYHLLNLQVPTEADVEPVDRFEPSFYGFLEKDYFSKRKLKVKDFDLGRSARSILTEPELSAANAKVEVTQKLKISKNQSLAIIGNGLAERMTAYGYFEREAYLHHPKRNLSIRNMARPGNTPAFRPHASRDSQWAFPGAESLLPQYEHHSGTGHHPTPDEWLNKVKADHILAFFGYNEAFRGEPGLDGFEQELRAFIQHTRTQNYNGKRAATLTLVSPIAFQDLSFDHNFPDGKRTNTLLKLYSERMKKIAEAENVGFINLFDLTAQWFSRNTEQLTVNGAHLNEEGYQRLSSVLASALFDEKRSSLNNNEVSQLLSLINEKNFFWFHHYRTPNGVHVDGRRYEPYGPDNYPYELEKSWQLSENREREIWATLSGKKFNRAQADARTREIPNVASNAPERAAQHYLYGEDALKSIKTADGFEIELFASEKEFPNLANPVQVSFDNKGRLWVAAMPSYPHYKPGDGYPDDKLLIYEDSNGDGKADKEIVFADKLHLPIGFEFTPEGVYVSQAPNLILLKDTDGDDRADSREIILSGFDTHDTHHAISAFTPDPFGNLILAEGVFLHSNIETAYGPVRAVNGGFYRFEPSTHKLTRLVQTHIPNPWGIAFDHWGQDFFLSTSNPDMHWMLPVSLRTKYGQLTVGTESLVESAHRVRPTSGLMFISSDNFPKNLQGDYILNNDIGFLGTKQHSIADEGAGYSSKFRTDLIQSSDPNFRLVDMDFAPDGTLYFADWHNQLIGHMQHNARDPLRDHAHGRIYRLRHTKGSFADNMDLSKLSENELWQALSRDPHDQQRQRIRSELRTRPSENIVKSRDMWLQQLKTNNTLKAEYLLDALWVSQSNAFDEQLVRTALNHDKAQVRAQAIRALRLTPSAFNDLNELLAIAAQDAHPRVRLEAVVSASWLEPKVAKSIVELAAKQTADAWAQQAYKHVAELVGAKIELENQHSQDSAIELPPELAQRWQKGKEIYQREGFCSTCHQADGKGLPAAQFPPLAETDWVTGNPARLIDIALNGLSGPIDVNGQHYPGHVPMTQFKGLLNDQEMADVLSYVRMAFGNQASAISAEQVAKVRKETEAMTGFWSSDALQKKYPNK